MINSQHCYAKHKNDVGKISTPFRIRIKDNCKLQTQRLSKVPIHYRDRLNKLLLELEKYNIIKQIGSTSDEKHTIGTTFLNPLTIIPNEDAIKVVLDARHLNLNTNQELESWPIEPLAPQLARANKKYKTTIDLMYAYAHTPLDEETIKLTGFSSGDKLYAFIRGFYGLKGLPNFFTKQMSTFFRSLIDKRSALVYIDDILLLANEKQEMFELIKELHTIASRENLKLAPEKSFYMLLKVKFLGHEIGNNTIKPIPSKIEAIKRIPSPKEKKDVMQFLGSANFYSNFIEKLYINLKPLYTLLHDDVKFQWTPELEKIFLMLSRTFTKEQLQVHQLRHKQLPPQIDFSIMKDNQLKPVHYLVKHEEIKYNQKNDCHPILADYGDDQFSIRINNKGEDLHIKPLDFFLFNLLFHLNQSIKSLQKTKQNLSYNNRHFLMILIFSVMKMN